MLLQLLLACLHVNGKYVSDTVRLRLNISDYLSKTDPTFDDVKMDGLHYMTHFACAKGRCSWSLRVRVVNPGRVLKRAGSNRSVMVKDSELFDKYMNKYDEIFENPESDESKTNLPNSGSVKLRVILDDEWDLKKLSHRDISPKVTGKECLSKVQSRLERDLNVPLNGSWSSSYSGGLIQSYRPHHWYFVLEDCEANYSRAALNMFGLNPGALLPFVAFEYELTLMNSDGSHLGYEYWYIPSYTFIVAVIASVGLGLFLYQQIYVLKSSNKMHPIVNALNIALGCLTFYLYSHWFHLMKFKVDGVGLPFLNGLGFMLRCLGNIGLMCCVFAVALGYSLDLTEMTLPGEPFIALASCYSLVEVILNFAQFKSNSFRYHLHVSEGVIPIITGIFRSLIAVAFVLSCESTLSRTDVANASVEVFLRKFRWRGMVMMASTPSIIAMTILIMPKHQQNRCIEIACVLAELIGIIYLGFAFLTEKTSYFKASVMGNSMLPFGGGGSTRRKRLD